MNLSAVVARIGRLWTIEVFPNANHDLIENGTICQMEGDLAPGVVPAFQEFLASLP